MNKRNIKIIISTLILTSGSLSALTVADPSLHVAAQSETVETSTGETTVPETSTSSTEATTTAPKQSADFIIMLLQEHSLMTDNMIKGIKKEKMEYYADHDILDAKEIIKDLLTSQPKLFEDFSLSLKQRLVQDHQLNADQVKQLPQDVLIILAQENLEGNQIQWDNLVKTLVNQHGIVKQTAPAEWTTTSQAATSESTTSPVTVTQHSELKQNPVRPKLPNTGEASDKLPIIVGLMAILAGGGLIFKRHAQGQEK